MYDYQLDNLQTFDMENYKSQVGTNNEELVNKFIDDLLEYSTPQSLNQSENT